MVITACSVVRTGGSVVTGAVLTIDASVGINGCSEAAGVVAGA